MSLTWKRALPVSLVVAILVSAVASLAFAGDGGSAPNGSFLARKGWAGRESGVILGYIAGKANVNVKTLMEELKTGKSLQDIAAEHGLDLAAIEARIASDRSNGGKQFFAPGGFGRRTPARRGGKGM